MVRRMCRSDSRFKLPAGHFSTNDLVLAFPPPPSRVYNPFYRLSSPKPSSHKDYDHFGRMRRWLIQTYSNVTWIFKDYDDFYPRDQTPSGHDEDDTPRLRVFVNDVYGLYEVAHWEDAEEQNVTSQKLLDLLEAIGPVDTDLSGGEMEQDLLPFFGNNQPPEIHDLEEEEEEEEEGLGDMETGLALNPSAGATMIETANPEPYAITSQYHNQLNKQSLVKTASKKVPNRRRRKQHLRLPVSSSAEMQRFAPPSSPLLSPPSPPGLFIPLNSTSTRHYTVADDPGEWDAPSNQYQQGLRISESPDPICTITTVPLSPHSGPRLPQTKTHGEGTSERSKNIGPGETDPES